MKGPLACTDVRTLRLSEWYGQHPASYLLVEGS